MQIACINFFSFSTFCSAYPTLPPSPPLPHLTPTALRCLEPLVGGHLALQLITQLRVFAFPFLVSYRLWVVATCW
jgi:hypothetical protein